MNGSHWFMFGLGLIFGGVASYVVTKKQLEKQMWEAYCNDHAADKKPDGDNRQVVEDDKDDVGKYKPDISSADLTAARLDSTRIANDAGYRGEVEKKKEKFPIGTDGDKRLITIEEFTDDETSAFAVINWYPDVSMATDEMDSAELDEVDELVGISNIKSIVKVGAEIGYIRNDTKKTNYEIHICPGVPSFME